MLLKCAARSIFSACVFLFAVAGLAQTTPPRSLKPSRSFPLTQFYDAPKPFAPGKPGDLIRSEPFDQYDLPLVVAGRVLFQSPPGTRARGARVGSGVYSC